MNRKDLVSILELIYPAVATDNLVPVFNCFAFRKGKVFTYNGTLGIEANCDVECEPFAVNGRVLLDLLRNCQVEDVTFSLDDENVHIMAGKSDLKLPYFNEESFIFEAPGDEKWELKTKLTQGLCDALTVCLTTSARDETMSKLMGVCFDQAQQALYSCDGDAITKYSIKLGADNAGPFTVPNKFCEAILKIAQATDTTDGLCSINEGWALCSIKSGYTVYSRMLVIDEPFTYQNHIDETLRGKHEFCDMPPGFNEALSRARVLADPESAKTVITIKSGRMGLETSTHMGLVKDDLPIKGHKDVTAVVHASLVQRSVEICNTFMVLDHATAYALDDKVLQVVSNIGE